MMKINFLNVAFAATVIVGNVIVSVSGQPLDPIQVNAFDPDSFGPSNCGLVLGAQETYDAPGWVFCISAICADQPTNDVNKYNGKPFVECQCWQQEVDDPTTDRSILPPAEFGGANCALDSGPGGAAMCDAIKGGALISTYGPRGATRDSGAPQFALEAATCTAGAPWAWCWGAPCRSVPGSPTGIIYDYPYMISTNNLPQQISLAGTGECAPTFPYNPCTSGLHNSMPAGTAPNSNPPCFVESGVEETSSCVDVCPAKKSGKKGGKRF